MIYMKIEGINGPVQTEGFKDCIEVTSVQYGVGRAVGMTTGAGRQRETSAPSMSEISITKMMDEASPHLFEEACSGETKEVTLTFVRTSGSDVQTYLEIQLTNCLVSGYSVSSGGDLPAESLSLAYTKIELSYTPYDSANKPGGAVRATYDLETAKKS